MKKRSKSKAAAQHPETDITGLILKLQEQLSGIERKLDTLLSRPSGKPAERTGQPKHFQRFEHPQRQERALFKAVCADCRKECEVPFRPTGDRPVYCKDCFSKRKNGKPFNERPVQQPRTDTPGFGKWPADLTQKPHEKKKPVTKKRKKT